MFQNCSFLGLPILVGWAFSDRSVLLRFQEKCLLDKIAACCVGCAGNCGFLLVCRANTLFVDFLKHVLFQQKLPDFYERNQRVSLRTVLPLNQFGT